MPHCGFLATGCVIALRKRDVETSRRYISRLKTLAAPDSWYSAHAVALDIFVGVVENSAIAELQDELLDRLVEAHVGDDTFDLVIEAAMARECWRGRHDAARELREQHVISRRPTIAFNLLLRELSEPSHPC